MSNEKNTHPTNDNQDGKTWAERNGGNIFGFGVFGALFLLIVVMWAANNL